MKGKREDGQAGGLAKVVRPGLAGPSLKSCRASQAS